MVSGRDYYLIVTCKEFEMLADKGRQTGLRKVQEPWE